MDKWPPTIKNRYWEPPDEKRLKICGQMPSNSKESLLRASPMPSTVRIATWAGMCALFCGQMPSNSKESLLRASPMPSTARIATWIALQLPIKNHPFGTVGLPLQNGNVCNTHPYWKSSIWSSAAPTPNMVPVAVQILAVNHPMETLDLPLQNGNDSCTNPCRK